MKEYHKINTIFKRDGRGNILEDIFSIPEIEYLKNNSWIFTEKIDGTNIRIIWTEEKVTIGGKTDNAQIPSFLISRLQDLFPLEKFSESFQDSSVCLYGEGYGSKIQKGGGNYIPDGVDFILFDVWIDGWWLKRQDVEQIADKFGIKIVPIVGIGTLSEAIDITRKGFNSVFGNFLAEGLVIKPRVDLFTRNGNRVVTKIKHKDFK